MWSCSCPVLICLFSYWFADIILQVAIKSRIQTTTEGISEYESLGKIDPKANLRKNVEWNCVWFTWNMFSYLNKPLENKLLNNLHWSSYFVFLFFCQVTEYWRWTFYYFVLNNFIPSLYRGTTTWYNIRLKSYFSQLMSAWCLFSTTNCGNFKKKPAVK